MRIIHTKGGEGMAKASGRGSKKRAGFPVGAALIALAALAAVLYLSGGVGVHRPRRENRAVIEETVAMLSAMENRAPVDLDAEAKQRRRELLIQRKGIMVDDMEAEQRKIMALDPADISTADLMRWFDGTALVGDSIVKALSTYGYLQTPVFARTGIRANAELALLDDVEAARPSVIFLCFGMNDIENYEERVEVFTRRYAQVIQRLQVSLPDAVIYVHAIFPGAERVLPKKTFYKYLDLYNTQLEALCEQLGVYYVDAGFILRQNPDFYNNDGQHMIRTFYPVWLTYLADIAGLSNE